MKQLTCEICGGKLVGKAGGIFVCDSCGMEYDKSWAQEKIQEIKGTVKVEGPVDVSGSTVKVDSSNELENLYIAARNAKKSDNSKLAKQLYDQILVKQPKDWEAMFYSVYYQSMDTNIAGITSAEANLTNIIDITLALVKEKNYSFEENNSILLEILLQISKISEMFFLSAGNHYFGIGDSIRINYKTEFNERTKGAISILDQYAICVKKLFDLEKYSKYSILAWKKAIEIIETMKDKSEFGWRGEWNKLKEQYSLKISRLELEKSNKNEGKKQEISDKEYADYRKSYQAKKTINVVEQRQEDQEKEQIKQKKKKKNKIIATFILIFIAVGAGIGIYYAANFSNIQQYEYGLKDMQQGEYDRAHNSFKNAGYYKDAQELMQKCFVMIPLEYYKEGDMSTVQYLVREYSGNQLMTEGIYKVIVESYKQKDFDNCIDIIEYYNEICSDNILEYKDTNEYYLKAKKAN